ncbi:SET domain-containing protein-lysine N-methyltransferase [Balamuthia mandrillaris]
MAEAAVTTTYKAYPGRVVHDEKFGKSFTLSWTHPDVIARKSALHGTGMVATKVIPQGTVVWKASEKERDFWFHQDEISTWSEEDQRVFHINAYQVAEGWWSGCTPGIKEEDRDISEYMNHSCEPTCWFVDDDTMVATRDIQPEEEITYDYATSETANSVHVKAGWQCRCGSKLCRGRLTGEEWKDPELRQRYHGHFTSFVQKLIDGSEESSSNSN